MMIVGALICFVELITVFVSARDIWVYSASLPEHGAKSKAGFIHVGRRVK